MAGRGCVTRACFRRPGYRGPALGMESRQLDPLGQLLGSREKLPPSRHRHHLGGARLEKGWGRPRERYMVAQEGDKKLFHTLFVSWIRVFWVEGGLSWVGLRRHAPLQLLSTTLSHLHHHLLQCSEDKIL